MEARLWRWRFCLGGLRREGVEVEVMLNLISNLMLN